MHRNFQAETNERRDSPPPSKAWQFAQALLGKSPSSPSREQFEAHAHREQMAWVAAISPEHKNRLRTTLREQADAASERSQLEWLAKISTRHESQLRRLLETEAEASEARGRYERLVESSNVQEEQWDPSKHPRRGGPPNAGWFASTGGGGGSSGGSQSPPGLMRQFKTALSNALGGPRKPGASGPTGSAGRSQGGGGSAPRPNLVQALNAEVSAALGGPTPGMVQARRLAVDVQSGLDLPGDVGRGAAKGLFTGAKAVANSSVTAIKNVATLGLSSSQLELIGVTDEDRENGYDTAATIATASGELLIAVGTAGIGTTLSKGGWVARSGSGVR